MRENTKFYKVLYQDMVQNPIVARREELPRIVEEIMMYCGAGFDPDQLTICEVVSCSIKKLSVEVVFH